MNIIILGPPASGKGTQGELLTKKLGLPRLSVGAVLRRVLKEGGKNSEEIGRYMLKGLNVPAETLFEVLESWFASHQHGFVVDNLPRDLNQLKEFKKFIRTRKIKINKAFHLNVSPEESKKRAAHRYQERVKNGEARPDEKPKVVETRIKEGYQKDILPILAFFRKTGVLVEINGEQSIEKVHQDILDNLNLK